MSFPSETGEERMLRNTGNEAKTLGKGPPLHSRAQEGCGNRALVTRYMMEDQEEAGCE